MACPQCFEDCCNLTVYTGRIDEINVRSAFLPEDNFSFLFSLLGGLDADSLLSVFSQWQKTNRLPGSMTRELLLLSNTAAKKMGDRTFPQGYF